MAINPAAGAVFIIFAPLFITEFSGSQRIIPASASRSLRLRLPRPDMQEICHDLGVLHVGAVADGFVSRSRLFNTFQLKTCFDQQIQPLAHRPRKPWSLELRQPLLRLRRRGPEEPFRDSSQFTDFLHDDVVNKISEKRPEIIHRSHAGIDFKHLLPRQPADALPECG